MLSYLLTYANLGYRVIPLLPGSKKPRLRAWQEQASSERGVIVDWITRWPMSNWGIVTGDQLAVLDIDPVALVSGWPGTDRAREIRATRCPVVSTPRRGFHLYFRASWPCTTGRIAPGVDTRGTGGYVVVPPSTTVHGRYLWRRPLRPVDELPQPPDWLAEAVESLAIQRPPRPITSTRATPECLLPPSIPEGLRNVTLARLAGYLRRAGMSQEELEAVLVDINNNRCSPPLPEPEVRAIARSIARYPPAPTGLLLGIRSPAIRRVWRQALAKRPLWRPRYEF